MRKSERQIALQTVNSKWMEHLAAMDYRREGIFLRGYAQQDPLVVYQKEAFEMFENMQHAIQDEIGRFMFRLQIVQEEEREPPRRQYNEWTNLDDGGGTARPAGNGPRPGGGKKPRRNDPCW